MVLHYSDVIMVAGMALLGTVATALIALRSKKGEKRDDAAIARENNVWKENSELRVQLKEATEKVAGMSDELVTAHALTAKLQWQLEDCERKSEIGALEPKRSPPPLQLEE